MARTELRRLPLTPEGATAGMTVTAVIDRLVSTGQIELRMECAWGDSPQQDFGHAVVLSPENMYCLAKVIATAIEGSEFGAAAIARYEALT